MLSEEFVSSGYFFVTVIQAPYLFLYIVFCTNSWGAYSDNNKASNAYLNQCFPHPLTVDVFPLYLPMVAILFLNHRSDCSLLYKL